MATKQELKQSDGSKQTPRVKPKQPDAQHLAKNEMATSTKQELKQGPMQPDGSKQTLTVKPKQPDPQHFGKNEMATKQELKQESMQPDGSKQTLTVNPKQPDPQNVANNEMDTEQDLEQECVQPDGSKQIHRVKPKQPPDPQHFANSEMQSRGMQYISLMASNLFQVKGLVTGDMDEDFFLRLFLVAMLCISIVIQIVSKTLVWIIYKAKVFAPNNVPVNDDKDDDDEKDVDDEEIDRTRRRNETIRKALKFAYAANYLTFVTTVINVMITTFALTT